MFIRKTKTRTMTDGTCYHAFRLVHNVRYGNRVKQETLLNLGSKFPVKESNWPKLCARIRELHTRQQTLLKQLPKHVEEAAERIAEQLMDRQNKRLAQAGLARGEVGEPIWKMVDVSSTQMRNVRSVGVEHVALWALEQLGIPKLLSGLRFPRKLRLAILGSIVGRMAKPGSERATCRWLCNESDLGEFLGGGGSFEQMHGMQLYRASDKLVAYRDSTEDYVFQEAMTMFGLDPYYS